MSTTGLAGKFREVRAGTKISLRFCRLPVRLQIWSGPTDNGSVAEPSTENTHTAIPTDLFSLAFHVIDRSANSHRKTSSPWPTTYETHPVASQEQLEGTGITRKGHSNPQILAPPSTVVADRRQCTHKPTITPNKTCSANLYRRIKKGWGAHLNEHIARGTWSIPESKLHINYLELKAVFLALKDLCYDKIVLVAGNNTTMVSHLNKEGGMRSCPVFALLWRILTLCTRKQVTQSLTHSRLAELGSRQAIQALPDHPDRVVSPSKQYAAGGTSPK